MALTGCVLGALPAYGQSGSQAASGQGLALEEIVVTARQRSELLSNTPIAITAFAAESIERLNIQSIEDLVKFTPGLTITKASQPNGAKLSLRGMQVDLGRSPVAIRVDEIDLTSESVSGTGVGFLANQRLMNLERIEVVKGAQVALYGRAAFAGAINYITKRPNLKEMDADFGINVNSEQEYEAKAGFSGPVVQDKFAVGVNASYWEDGGSYKNQLNGQKLGVGDGVGVAGSIYATPSEQLSIYSRMEYAQDKHSMAAGGIIEPTTLIRFPADVATVVRSPQALIFTGTVPDFPKSSINLQLDPFTGRNFTGVDKDTFVASLIVDYALDGFGFKSLTGWLEQKVFNQQSTTWQATPYVNNGVPNINGGIVPAFNTTQAFDLFTNERIFNQELRLYSNSDSRLQWQVGGLYWEEETDQAQDQPTLLPIIPVTTRTVNDFLRRELGIRLRKYGRDTYHYSGYAWFEYDVTEQFAVSGEVRYNDENNDYKTFQTVNVSTVTGTTANPIITQVSVVPPNQALARVSETFTTPKATLTFKPNEDHTAYASAAKSVKPGGHNTGGADAFTAFTRFLPEKLWSYEVGLKSRMLDNRLSTDVALFYQDYTNQQVATVVLDTTSNVPRGATENAGKSRRWGLDFEGKWNASENLTLSGGYTYVNTKFTSYEFFTSAALTAAQGPCIRFETFVTGQRGCIISWTGNEAGQVPKHQFSTTANWTAQLNNDYDWFAETNVRYTAKRFLNNSNLSTAPDYFRVDMRAGVVSDSIQAWVYANNVLDDKTAIDIASYLSYNTSTFSPAPLVYLPDPVTVGLKLTFKM